MHDEFLTVEVSETGDQLQVKVFSKHRDRITVVLGEGQHCVRCELTPTPNGMAYAGSALGREIVYARSPDQVQADLDRLDPRRRPR